jgi:hypothetical protein
VTAPLAYDGLPAPADPAFVARLEAELADARVRALEVLAEQRREAFTAKRERWAAEKRAQRRPRFVW